MADPTPTASSAAPAKPKRSLRMERREARRAFVQQAAAVRRVRVVPANEQLRNSIRHPRFGGFRSTGSIEWPLDNFVKRRIKEGSIKIEPRPKQEKPPQHTTRQGPRVLGSTADKPVAS